MSFIFKDTDTIEQEMRYLKHHLQAKTQPQGNILLFKELSAIDLDYSAKSIQQLDKLFNRIHTQQITLSDLLAKKGGKNFIVSVAGYVVNCIADRVDQIPIWKNQQKMLEESLKVGEFFQHSIGAMFDVMLCFPLVCIRNALDSSGTLYDFVEEYSEKILNHSFINPYDPTSTVCNNYLKKVRTGKLIDKTMSYHEQLQEIDFDYSIESIQKIDELLIQIKQKERLTSDDHWDYINDTKNQSFLMFLGFYVGATGAKLANTAFKWLNYEQAQEIINDPDFLFCLEQNQVMMFSDGCFRFPVLPVTNALFETHENSAKSCCEFLDVLIPNQQANLKSFPLAITSDKQLPANWQTACELAGSLAAWNLVHISDGGEATPKSIKFNAETNTQTIIQHMISSDEEFKYLLEGLDHENTDKPYDFLSYDMYVNVPMGRTDGVCIEVRCYQEPKLNLQFVLPYRHADSHLGFAIFPLINHQNADIDTDYLDAMAQAFYVGSKSITSPEHNTDYWTAYYIDKHDIHEPALHITQPVTRNFDESDSAIRLYDVELSDDTDIDTMTKQVSDDVMKSFEETKHENMSHDELEKHLSDIIANTLYDDNNIKNHNYYTQQTSHTRTEYEDSSSSIEYYDHHEEKVTSLFTKIIIFGVVALLVYGVWSVFMKDDPISIIPPQKNTNATSITENNTATPKTATETQSDTQVVTKADIQESSDTENSSTSDNTVDSKKQSDVLFQVILDTNNKLPYTFIMDKTRVLKNISFDDDKLLLEVHLTQDVMSSVESNKAIFCMDRLFSELTRQKTPIDVHIDFYRTDGNLFFSSKFNTTDCR